MVAAHRGRKVFGVICQLLIPSFIDRLGFGLCLSPDEYNGSDDKQKQNASDNKENSFAFLPRGLSCL